MAIAFDSNGGTTVGASPRTFSHTCTGTNLVLLVATFQSIAGLDHVTGVTYNSAAMNFIGSSPGNAGGDTYTIDWWYLAGPSTGANNVVMSTLTNATSVGGLSVSYTGASQTGIPDNSAQSGNVSGGGRSLTTSITTIADNCWTIMASSDGGSNSIAGTGSTSRVPASQPGGSGIFDSNGVIHPAGSNSMNFTWTGGNDVGNAFLLSIAPVGAGTTKINRRALLGVGT